MKRTAKTFLLLSFIAVGSACSNMTTQASSDLEAIKESKFYKQYPSFDATVMNLKFKENIRNNKDLKNLYSSVDNDLIWIKDTLNVAKLDSLTSILSTIDRHGLEADRFPIHELSNLTQQVDDGYFRDDITKLYQTLMQIEKLASTSAFEYTKGMRFGFLAPRNLYGNNYAIAIDRLDDKGKRQIYAGFHLDVIKTMKDAEPQSAEYVRLQEQYVKLKTLSEKEQVKISSPGKDAYKLFDKGKNVAKIAQRLAFTGEYQLQDTVSPNPAGSILDAELLEAVNKFRRENTFFEDQIVGEQTIQALNRPIEFYVEKIKANLERYRWRRSKEKHEKHIEVNIAPQLLFATSNNNPALEMRVAVGSLNNKTPLLQSEISYINLNPIWNVPKSIASKELSIKQKNNRSYLQRNNMKLYKNGKEINIESVDWNSVNPDAFGYSIKQASGDQNALGKMKFMFNNNFSVYLHDTPSKGIFNKRARAVSHGCIRLHQPIDLALFLTKLNDAAFADRLYHTIDLKAPSAAGRKLQAENKLQKMGDILRMDEDVSLFIDYYTVYFKPQDNSIYYADDVYAYDKLILENLSKQKHRW